jgi:hypothetical protein
MDNMNTLTSISTLFGLALATASAVSFSQTSSDKAAPPASRNEIKMELQDFKNSHRYDDVLDVWTLKPEYAPPKGMKSRAEIIAERNVFLSMNRYDAGTQNWVKIPGSPRDMSTMSRDEVKRERDAFLNTHMYDNTTSLWVLKTPRK